MDIYYGQGMVLNNFTCLTSFKSHQPWTVGIVLLIFQQRNLGLARISPPDHTASSIQIRISLTEGLSSQPSVSSQGQVESHLLPAQVSNLQRHYQDPGWPLTQPLSHALTSMGNECNCLMVFEHSLVLPFLGTGMRIDLFQSCSHCWIF